MRIYLIFIISILFVSCNDYVQKKDGYTIKGKSKIIFNNTDTKLNDYSIISGFVYSRDSKEFIEFANININEKGTTTDKNGYFEIKIEPGIYTVSANSIGNTEEKLRKVKIEKNKKIIIMFELGTETIY